MADAETERRELWKLLKLVGAGELPPVSEGAQDDISAVLRRVESRLPDLAADLSSEQRDAGKTLAAVRAAGTEDLPAVLEGARVTPTLLDEIWLELQALLGHAVPRSAAIAEAVARAAESLGASPVEQDSRAFATALWANVLRVQGDLVSAREALGLARSFLRNGLGCAEPRATIDGFEASLLIDCSEPDQATDLLRRTLRIRELEPDQRCRILAILARGLTNANRTAEAIAAHLEVVSTVDVERNPRLAVATMHNLAKTYLDAGQLVAAEELFKSFDRLASSVMGPRDIARRTWCHATIATKRKQWGRAEALFLEAVGVFLAEEAHLDVAFCGLELAALYSETGQASELIALTKLIHPVFESRQLRREAVAVLVGFRTAVVQREVSRLVVERTTDLFVAASRKRLRLV